MKDGRIDTLLKASTLEIVKPSLACAQTKLNSGTNQSLVIVCTQANLHEPLSLVRPSAPFAGTSPNPGLK